MVLPFVFNTSWLTQRLRAVQYSDYMLYMQEAFALLLCSSRVPVVCSHRQRHVQGNEQPSDKVKME